MGGLCSSGARELVDSEVKEDTEETVKEVAEHGFVNKRHCTDILCLIIWAVFIGFFLVISFMGFADGNPVKLYRPRDHQGAYCGTETNWNGGPNLVDQPKLGYTMNVTSAGDTAMKQFMCSSTVREYLETAFTDPNDLEVYLCECCYSPCAKCSGSLSVGGDITGDLTAGNLMQITNRMSELTDPSKAAALFSTAGANGDLFSSIWASANKFFVKVCLPSCDYSAEQMANSSLEPRVYQFEPAPDQLLRKSWDLVKTHFDGTSFMEAFNFNAYPRSVCPYAAEYCVPMPGVNLADLSAGYCTFEMNAQIVDSLGSALTSTFETLGGDSFVESATENFGAWWGDFQESIDTFVLVCLCSFVVGLIYLVLLRFTVGFCVWFAIFLILLALLFGGAASYVRSIQCQGAGLFETGTQTVVAIAVAGRHATTNLVTGKEASEELVGDGADYRGHQTRTRSGILCQGWDETSPHDASSYSSERYPDAGLESKGGTVNNFCRNPYDDNTTFPARSIWCFTTSAEIRWELCLPIGVIAPECENGYAVAGADMRKALQIMAYVIWGLGVLWILIVLCFWSRISLAIALNKVAAEFLANTPTVLLVPVVQTVLGCAWVLGWMFMASFLLSQVPSSYTPTESYATYAEAYGTVDTPGKCTDKWPTGFVWREAAENCLDGKCWRCAPPRYIFDWRFGVSFFGLLWNNAFLIAFGQCVIAGAVGVWFFTANDKKGKLGMGQALRKSNWNVWRYHTGSLAFGSFILAVVQFIKYFLKYLEKNAQAQKNRVLAMIYRVLGCLVWCFERFVKFLNKNAYIQVAIRGTPFCTSARKAWQIICSNVLRFGTVALLGSAIHSIGIVFIIASTMVIGYFLMQAMHSDISPVIPLIVYFFLGFVVANLFMNVFGLAVDTCLQCVIFAEEKCPEGNFVPKCLKRVIDKSQAPKEQGTE